MMGLHGFWSMISMEDAVQVPALGGRDGECRRGRDEDEEGEGGKEVKTWQESS
jgi:hypothetical protein